MSPSPTMPIDALGGNPEVILIGSGSEVSLFVQAHEQLLDEGIRSRVVSIQWKFGFEPEGVAEIAKELLGKSKQN